MSTPTDALIEKMARAMYESENEYGHAFDRGAGDPLIRLAYMKLARAAYEAEHEETKG